MEKELQEKDLQIDSLRGEIKALQRDLERCSRQDELTGLLSRPAFEGMLQKEWERCKRHAIPLCLILADIDKLGKFNELYGYKAGDECIQKVAGVMAHCARRASDIVGRFGGDKFIAALPHLAKDKAFDLAGQMEESIAQVAILHAGSPVGLVSASFGLHAAIPAEGMTAQEFVRIAEIALYEAKQDGNRICSRISFL